VRLWKTGLLRRIRPQLAIARILELQTRLRCSVSANDCDLGEVSPNAHMRLWRSFLAITRRVADIAEDCFRKTDDKIFQPPVFVFETFQGKLHSYLIVQTHRPKRGRASFRDHFRSFCDTRAGQRSKMILQRNTLNQEVIMVFSLPNCSSVLIGFENKSSGCLAAGSSAIALLKYILN
jgi:hypothetical protein